MRKLRTLLLVASTLSFFGLAFGPATVLAAPASINNVCNQAVTTDATACNDAKRTDNPLYGPGGILTRVTQILVFIIGIVAVIMIIVGGFRYILSNGDAGAVNTAKNSIIYALVGLGVAILAQGIVSFVLNKL